MSDKLDFSGFGDQSAPTATPVASPPKRPSRNSKKARKGRPSRRKIRVNVSLEPSVSSQAIEQAHRRGMTLSDLLRAAYRDHFAGIEESWFESPPPPFGHRSLSAPGRVVHMLYLTGDEVEILDGLASEYGTSRSGVVGVLLSR